MFAFAMLSSLCFEQLNSPTYPMGTTLPLYWRFGSTWKLGHLDYLHEGAVAADDDNDDDKDPLFTPPPANAGPTGTTQVVLRRRRRAPKVVVDKSRRKSTPPVWDGSLPQAEDETFSLPTALRQTLALKAAQLNSYARLFSQQLGLPSTEGYERMPPLSHRPPLESAHKLFSQLQRLFRSRYARLNEIPSFCEAAEDLAGSAAEEEETRTVVTYISLTDRHPPAESNGCSSSSLPEGKLGKASGGGDGVSTGGQFVLANTKGVRLRMPKPREQKRHISWKDLALDAAAAAAVAEGSVRQMLVSPILPTTEFGHPAREADDSKRCIASGRHQAASQLESQKRSTFSCTAELSSQLTTTTTATTPREEDRHRMQIQQIKRLIASQRRCHKWFFTLYEFDKPANAEETAKLESSLFNIIINRLHWIYALSVSDLFVPTGRETTGPTAETYPSTPCHDNTILTKFAVTQQQVDKRLRFKVRRLSRRPLGPSATQDLGRHLNRPPRHHHGCSTAPGSRKRFDPARNLFAYSLLQERSPSPRTHSAERGPGVGDPSSQVLPPKSAPPPLKLSTTTVPTSGISCVHYGMFSRLSPHNPGQLICGGGEAARSCGVADLATSKVYCSDCGRNIMTGCSSVASTVGSSELGSSRQQRQRQSRLRCASSEDSLLCVSRSRTTARGPTTAAAEATIICYAMSRSVEFCSTLRQLRSEQAAGHLAGRMTLPRNVPAGCQLEPPPRWWPHHEGTHKEATVDWEAVKAHTNEHPRKRRRRCHRDQRSTSANVRLLSVSRDQQLMLHEGGDQETSSPPDSEAKRRIRSRKLRHWLQKRLGQRRVEDWLKTSWTTDEAVISAE